MGRHKHVVGPPRLAYEVGMEVVVIISPSRLKIINVRDVEYGATGKIVKAIKHGAHNLYRVKFGNGREYYFYKHQIRRA